MAAGGKTHCPVCNASSGKDDFGRDGSPRELDRTRPKFDQSPTVTKRRNRAQLLRLKNERYGARG